MAKERVRVLPEIKIGAIEAIKAGRPRQEVADELGVALATVHLWMSKAKGKTPPNGLQSPIPSRTDNEADELQRRIQLLELENDYLKKRLALYEEKAT